MQGGVAMVAFQAFAIFLNLFFLSFEKLHRRLQLRSARLPAEGDLRRAAEILNRGKRVAILAGRGAIGAADELEQVAEKLAAPIIKPLLGKGAVPDQSPYTTGGIGLLGTRPSEDLMSDIDTLFMVGTNFPYTKHLPPPGKVRVAQIEADPTRAGARMPTELPVVGDSKHTLQALLPLLKQRNGTSFLSKYQKEMGKWRQNMASLVSADQRASASALGTRPRGPATRSARKCARWRKRWGRNSPSKRTFSGVKKAKRETASLFYLLRGYEIRR